MRLQSLQSQRGIPSQTGLQGPDPRAAGLVGGAVADLGETAVRLTTALQDRRTQLQQAEDALNADNALHEAAEGLLTDLATDPEHREMETRYQARFKEVEARVVKPLQGQAQLQAKRSALAIQTQLAGAVRSRAVTLQKESFEATLEIHLDRLAQDAAAAPDEAAPEFAGRAVGAIRSGVAGGVYARDTGVKRAQKWRDDFLQARATRMITQVGFGATDMETALQRLADPKDLFAEADPTKREGWTKAVLTAAEAYQNRRDKRQREVEAAAQKHSSNLRNFFFDKALRGDLTADAVAKVGPREAGGDGTLLDEDYRAIRQLIQKQFEAGGVDDPRAVHEVRRQIIFGTADPRAVIARGGRDLSQETAAKLAKEARDTAEADHPTKQPAWTFYRDQLFRDLTGIANPMAMPERLTGKQLAKLGLGMEAWWDRTVNKREDPALAYKALRETLLALPGVELDAADQPRFASKEITIQAYERKIIGQDELNHELEKHRAIETQAVQTDLAPKAPEGKKKGFLEGLFGDRSQ